MSSHCSPKPDELKINPDEITDIYDGFAYQDAMADRVFGGDGRNVMLGVATDGVQPFRDDDQYSVWPLVVTPYNLPPHLRYRLGVTTVLGIIWGKRSKKVKFDIQPYLDILVDELKYLNEVGWSVLDIHTKSKFTCRVRVIQVLSDLRGLEKVFDVPATPGRHACLWCWVKGYKACTPGHQGKTIYPTALRVLPKDHALRAPLAAIPVANGVRWMEDACR